MTVTALQCFSVIRPPWMMITAKRGLILASVVQGLIPEKHCEHILVLRALGCDFRSDDTLSNNRV